MTEEQTYYLNSMIASFVKKKAISCEPPEMERLMGSMWDRFMRQIDKLIDAEAALESFWKSSDTDTRTRTRLRKRVSYTSGRVEAIRLEMMLVWLAAEYVVGLTPEVGISASAGPEQRAGLG